MDSRILQTIAPGDEVTFVNASGAHTGIVARSKMAPTAAGPSGMAFYVQVHSKKDPSKVLTYNVAGDAITSVNPAPWCKGCGDKEARQWGDTLDANHLCSWCREHGHQPGAGTILNNAIALAEVLWPQESQRDPKDPYDHCVEYYAEQLYPGDNNEELLDPEQSLDAIAYRIHSYQMDERAIRKARADMFRA